MPSIRIGYWSVIASYICWGFMPLYTRQFSNISMLEFLVHRVIWSAVILIVLMLLQGKFFKLLQQLTLKRIGVYSVSAFLVAANWYLFVWAILKGDITEASLGYFINPLVSVVLGLMILHEKLRKIQILAISIVVFGVVLLGFAYGKFPWLALCLGASFGLYGLIRKMGDLNAVEGLTLEMLLLLPFILDLKLMTIGIITAVPMLIFIFGVQRISMTSLGVIQYLGPTLQFLSGVIIFHEIIDQHRLMGYSTVWFGLLIFAIEGMYQSRKNQVSKIPPVMMD